MRLLPRAPAPGGGVRGWINAECPGGPLVTISLTRRPTSSSGILVLAQRGRLVVRVKGRLGLLRAQASGASRAELCVSESSRTLVSNRATRSRFGARRLPMGTNAMASGADRVRRQIPAEAEPNTERRKTAFSHSRTIASGCTRQVRRPGDLHNVDVDGSIAAIGEDAHRRGTSRAPTPGGAAFGVHVRVDDWWHLRLLGTNSDSRTANWALLSLAGESKHSGRPPGDVDGGIRRLASSRGCRCWVCSPVLAPLERVVLV